MSDIASLGIRIDSRETVAATTALDKFAAAAKPAVAGATALEKAAAGAAKGTSSITQAGGLARHELVNLSRQVQDVGVSLASGQSPFTVLIQQGTQIADIFGSSRTATVGGAIKQVTSGIASFLTPARLLGGGIAAVGLAGYAAYQSWKAFALQLDDTAKSVGTTTSEMAKLQAVASFKGISGEDFSKGIVQFGRGVYDAKNNMGGLAELFRANNASASTFDGYLEKAADLIKNAKDDQQRLVLLQQMGLPATLQWARMLSGGADGLRKAKAAAVEFGGAANDNLVAKARAFDEGWDKAWTNFGLYARAGVASAAGGIAKLMADVNRGLATSGSQGSLLKMFGKSTSGDFSDFYEATNAAGDAKPRKPTVDPAALRNAIAMEASYVAVINQTLTPAQMLAAAQEKLQAATDTKGANDERKQHRTAAAA